MVLAAFIALGKSSGRYIKWLARVRSDDLLCKEVGDVADFRLPHQVGHI
jgi:hypothetical protein